MPPRKRGSAPSGDLAEPVAKRRSSRQAAAAAASSSTASKVKEPAPTDGVKSPPKTVEPKKTHNAKVKTKDNSPAPTAKATKNTKKPSAPPKTDHARSVSPDPDPGSIPRQNPDAVRHDGTWYWLLKAEPESRFENEIDVRFSIDDLRACTKPEGWDGMSPHFDSPQNVPRLTMNHRHQIVCR